MAYDSVELKEASFAVLEDDAVTKLVFKKNNDDFLEVGLGVDSIPPNTFVQARTRFSGDGVAGTNDAIGSEWLHLEGEGDFAGPIAVDLTFYKYGVLMHFTGPLFEWDSDHGGTQAPGQGSPVCAIYTPDQTVHAFQMRNFADTAGIELRWQSGIGFSLLTDTGEDLHINAAGDLQVDGLGTTFFNSSAGIRVRQIESDPISSSLLLRSTNGVNVAASNTAVGAASLIMQGVFGQLGPYLRCQNSSDVVSFEITKDGIPVWVAAGNQQTTVGAAGAASALPATPTKYLKVKDSSGSTLVIPAYAA